LRKSFAMPFEASRHTAYFNPSRLKTLCQRSVAILAANACCVACGPAS